MSAQDEHGGDVPREEGNKTYYPSLGCSHCPASFYSHENHEKHQVERHPDKPRAEAWESSEGHKVTYIPNFNRATPHLYVLTDMKTGLHLSNLAIGHKGELDGVQTHSKHRRQGHASELWNAANEHAAATPGVPTPHYSSTVTSLGEKWTKATAKRRGEEPPKRHGTVLSARQMMGMLDLDRQ